MTPGPAAPHPSAAATRPHAPRQVDDWLTLAAQAPDPHTALDYAQRALDARPDDPRVQASIQRGVFGRLGQDAFVAYVGETASSYVVSFRGSRPVAVPKSRIQPSSYPPAHLTPAQRIWRLVGLMLVGLIPAGLGALALGPLVMPRAAALAADERADPCERRSAWLALVTGAGLGLVGAALALVLLLHVIA